jgi:hypothetical protein
MLKTKTTMRLIEWRGEIAAPDIRELGQRFMLPYFERLPENWTQAGGVVGLEDGFDRWPEDAKAREVWGRRCGVEGVVMCVAKRVAPESLVVAVVGERLRMHAGGHSDSRCVSKARYRELCAEVHEELDPKTEPTLKGVEVLKAWPGMLVLCSAADGAKHLLDYYMGTAWPGVAKGWQYVPIANECILGRILALAALGKLRLIGQGKLKVVGSVQFVGHSGEKGDCVVGGERRAAGKWLEQLKDADTVVGRLGLSLKLDEGEGYEAACEISSDGVIYGWSVKRAAGTVVSKEQMTAHERMEVLHCWHNAWKGVLHELFGWANETAAQELTAALVERDLVGLGKRLGLRLCEALAAEGLALAELEPGEPAALEATEVVQRAGEAAEVLQRAAEAFADSVADGATVTISGPAIERITVTKLEAEQAALERELGVSPVVAQARAGAPAENDVAELFEQAKRLVIETRRASVSMLQRRFKIGYTRAALLMDLLESDKIVGPPGEHGTMREVLAAAPETDLTAQACAGAVTTEETKDNGHE